MRRQDLARTAIRAAFEVRKKVGLASSIPICIYDLSEQVGAKVLFVGGSSFSGMYSKDSDYVLVPSERPPGRKAFTCAHELGHWWFNHGTRVEELDFDRADIEIPEENIANIFAAYLLMPRSAVVDAFSRRRIAATDASAIDIYAAACQLGVGYETLVKHLRWSLNVIDHARMKDLLSIPPKEIRRAILDASSATHLVLADLTWHTVAIDLQVGEVAVLPSAVIVKGSSLSVEGICQHGVIVRATKPGLSQAICEEANWSAMVRVSRFQFTGLGRFRHLEEVEDENE